MDAFSEWSRQAIIEARKRAKRKGNSCTIDRGFVLGLIQEAGGCCQLTGIPFDLSDCEHFRRPFAPSIDRIDSNRGYDPDNVRIVCVMLNLAMNQFGEDNFAKIAEAYIEKTRPPRTPAVRTATT